MPPDPEQDALDRIALTEALDVMPPNVRQAFDAVFQLLDDAGIDHNTPPVAYQTMRADRDALAHTITTLRARLKEVEAENYKLLLRCDGYAKGSTKGPTTSTSGHAGWQGVTQL